MIIDVRLRDALSIQVKAADGFARTMQLYVESCFEDFYTHTITCINEQGERVRPLLLIGVIAQK